MNQAYSDQAYAVESDARTMAVTNKRSKKPNFISRWFWAGLQNAAKSEQTENDIISLKERAMLKSTISAGESLNSEPMRFSVYHAVGGFVVETRTPSRHSKNTIGPESNTKLHIIHKDADLGQEIAKIITMEGLRA
jgi:hypothetical protein